jgi:hypothetical protein
VFLYTKNGGIRGRDPCLYYVRAGKIDGPELRQQPWSPRFRPRLLLQQFGAATATATTLQANAAENQQDLRGTWQFNNDDDDDDATTWYKHGS